MMKKEYDSPKQVIFYDPDEGEHHCGIAYGDEIICLCCGGIFELDEVEVSKVLRWISVEEECGGDELADVRKNSCSA